MTPLKALGLDEEADERAVKRAYARRLKVTRPDEDPAGFQKLHETYQAALAYLRWRAANPDAEWYDDDDVDDEDEEAASDSAPSAEEHRAAPGMPASEFEALIGNPRYAEPKPEPIPEPDAPPRVVPQVERVREQPAPFELDLGEFLRRFFEEVEASTDERQLRAWLVRETADWPIWVKPRVARDLLQHIYPKAASFTPEQLEVVVDHFGFDDVQTGIDPIGLEEMRVEADKRLRQRSAKFAHLFDPANREELSRYMAQPERGSHFGFVTRAVAGLLTSRRAYEWAFWLRPVPFANRFVMGFLRDIDSGRVEGFGPHVDRMALEFWQWAEMRREANRGIRWVLIIVGLIASLAYVTGGPRDRSGPGYSQRPGRTVLQPADAQRARELGERIRQANKMEAADGLVEYDKLLAELPPPPWGAAMEEIVALVHYNRAVILVQLGRAAEARPGYEEVDRLLGNSVVRQAQIVVAKALVNLGYVLIADGALREALAPFQKVVARYGESREDQLELQVAKALNARAGVFRRLGEPDEARHALDELLRRYGDRTKGDLGELVAKARERRAALDAAGGASGSPGESAR